MLEISQQERDVLTQALTKARHLVAELENQQAEIEKSPPNIPPEKLADGRTAFTNAIAAAKRSLKALEEAAAMVGPDSNRN